ncbi:MAG: class I SAM-dependent methyltransferase [Acidovorax sp.]|jgi:cyclopropane-fatty-acyl-phospholipid synthase|nr:class I SAM-dependent methyltransferase [Acidovorax sp.]
MKAMLPHLEARLASLPTAVQVQLPHGQLIGPDDAPVRVQLHSALALAMLADGQIGSLATAVVEGQVDLYGHMRDVMGMAASLLEVDPRKEAPGRWSSAVGKLRSRAMHTLTRDAQQIQFHYDLSDDFYALWLDPRRVYSCAYYREPGMGLAQAQEAKLDHICRKLRLKPGERFLDIGAGWGGLLLWAAEHYGVQAHGITLSRNQHEYVRRLITAKGLESRVHIELCDYRDKAQEAPFDKVASVGMFEHVGRAHMPVYFQAVKKLLKPGGMALIHGITAAGVDNLELGAGMGEFIERYIFPGGELLHVSTMLHDAAQAGLEMVDTENLRPHYARTLWAWSDALEAQLPQAANILRQQVAPERAQKALKAYRLYLAGCAMAFEQGWIALHQMLLTHPNGRIDHGSLRGAQSSYPFQRDYMYR